MRSKESHFVEALSISQLKKLHKGWEAGLSLSEISKDLDLSEGAFMDACTTLTGLTPDQVEHIFSQTNRRIFLRDISDAYNVDIEDLRILLPDWEDRVKLMKVVLKECRSVKQLAEKFRVSQPDAMEMMLNLPSYSSLDSAEGQPNKHRKLDETGHQGSPRVRTALSKQPQRLFRVSQEKVSWTHLASMEKNSLALQELHYPATFAQLPDTSLLFVSSYRIKVWLMYCPKDFAVLLMPPMKRYGRLSFDFLYFKEYVYAIGGYTVDCERFCINNRLWHRIPDLPFRLVEFAAVGLELTNSIYVMGGKIYNSLVEPVFVLDLNSMLWRLIKVSNCTGSMMPCFTASMSESSIFYIKEKSLCRLDVLTQKTEVIKEKAFERDLKSSAQVFFWNQRIFYSDRYGHDVECSVDFPCLA